MNAACTSDKLERSTFNHPQREPILPVWMDRCCTLLGLPGGTVVKKSSADIGDTGLIPGLGRDPAVGNGNPLQYSCLENPIDRGLVGYSPWGHRVRHDWAHMHSDLRIDFSLLSISMENFVTVIILDLAY